MIGSREIWTTNLVIINTPVYQLNYTLFGIPISVWSRIIISFYFYILMPIEGASAIPNFTFVTFFHVFILLNWYTVSSFLIEEKLHIFSKSSTMTFLQALWYSITEKFNWKGKKKKWRLLCNGQKQHKKVFIFFTNNTFLSLLF